MFYISLSVCVGVCLYVYVFSAPILMQFVYNIGSNTIGIGDLLFKNKVTVTWNLSIEEEKIAKNPVCFSLYFRFIRLLHDISVILTTIMFT